MDENTILSYVSNKNTVPSEHYVVQKNYTLDLSCNIDTTIKLDCSILVISNIDNIDTIQDSAHIEKIDNEKLLYIQDVSSISIHSSIDQQVCVYEIINVVHSNVSNNMDFPYIETNNIFLIQNKNILSHELCDKIIEFYNSQLSYNDERWEASHNVFCKYIHLNSLNSEAAFYLDKEIFNVVNKVIHHLYFTYNVKSNGDSGYCIRKIYGPTRLHCDNVVEDSSQHAIGRRRVRNMSVIMCLNDDYDGGEFVFPTQNYSVKLNKGDIIAFPPYWTHPHKVNTPLNGTYRYTVNTWLYQ